MIELALFLLAPPMAWIDHNDGRIELQEDGKTALVYNYGPQLSNNAPEDRRRCCYIFPVMTPGGVSMLDDFPKDHWHHHGVFWAWPVVETPQGKYDLWMYKGVQHRMEKVLGHGIEKGNAFVAAANGWFVGEKRIVGELVRITVFPSKGDTRELEVALRFEAMDQPVTLRGSQEKGKSYGGFSARFAPREETVIRADSTEIPKDEDVVPHQWAELEAVYQGKKAILRITPDSANPGVPYQWCLRPYGFVGASFPGRTEKVSGYTIEPGKALQLKFRVSVSDVK